MTAFSSANDDIIRAQLSPAATAALARLSLLDQARSTNEVLLQSPAGEAHGHAVIADHQTAGRGRRGKQWQSPPRSNIYLSLAWDFPNMPTDFSCLSLALGVCVVRALEQQGLNNLGLKWPNDIQAKGKKLSGILVESTQSGRGTILVVAGVGINVSMVPDSPSAQAIDQPWTAVCDLPGVVPDSKLRDVLTGALLDELLLCMSSYATTGFKPYREEWQELDVLRGKPVTVFVADRVLQGVAQGIDEMGKLILEETRSNGEKTLHHLSSGEVSVRLA